MPYDEIPALVQRARPGQGGVFLWLGSTQGNQAVIGVVVRELRESGVFLDARESPHNHYHPDIDGPVTWTLGYVDVIVRTPGGRSELPTGPLLTFGLIPEVDSTQCAQVFRLVHVGGPQIEERTVIVPSHGGEVIGLCSALVVSLHPDWHISMVETKRVQRMAARIVTEVLRAVVDAEQPP